jgi:hypothetical protein
MGELSLSVALPPSARIPEYARAAEDAGCTRLWLFDSPAATPRPACGAVIRSPAAW